MMEESNHIEINVKTTRKAVERFFDVNSFKSSEQKCVLAQIQLIFKTCYVLILTYHDYPRSLMFSSVDQLIEKYPSFAELERRDPQELEYLLNYRNYLRVALLIIPARLNKQCLLKIAARLEGSQNEYITGGGQKPSVTRRVDIYENEGQIQAEKRPDRPRKEITKQQPEQIGVKRISQPPSTVTSKKLKLIRLPTDELRLLSKGPADPFPEFRAANVLAQLSNVKNEPGAEGDGVVTDFLQEYYECNESVGTTFPAAAKEGRQVSDLESLMRQPIRGQSKDWRREMSGNMDSFLISTDSEFWREALESINPSNVVRSVSLGLTSRGFTEDLRNFASSL